MQLKRNNEDIDSQKLPIEQQKQEFFEKLINRKLVI